MSLPISPPPLTQLAADRLLAHLGNGLIGLRVGRVPLFDGLAIVQRLLGPHPKDAIPTFAPAPYPLAGDIAIDGRRASTEPDAIEFVDQRLDFATGELMSRFTFRAGVTTAEADVLTFLSRTDPALVLQEVVVRCDRDARVELTAAIGTAEVPGRWVEADGIPRGEPPTADAWLTWESPGGVSRCGLVIAVVRDGPDEEVAVDTRELRGLVSVARTADARAGRAVRLRSILGLVPSLAHPRPHRQAALLVARGLARGWTGWWPPTATSAPVSR